jgi:hypothetical protein
MLQIEDRMDFILLEYTSRFGKPNGYFSFKSKVKNNNVPSEVIIFYWFTNEINPSTVFCTLGMSVAAMEDGESAEMRMSVRGKLDSDEIMAFCRFIANFAIYPFIHEFAMDWWSLIIDVGQVPIYSDSNSLLIHPEFSDPKFGNIKIGDITVKLFNIVPLTREEAHIVEENGVPRLLDYIADNKIDMSNIR